MLYDYATGDLAPEERGGTAAERFADNLAAIALARALKGQGDAAGAAAGARRDPTDAERAVLLRYVGWGEYDVRRHALNIGDAPTSKLAALGLSAVELDALKRSSLTAYYTPRWLVAEMWRAALRLGIGDMPRAPLVLEPSCGSGLFLALRPPCVPEDALCAAEIDPLAAAVAQAAQPRATIHQTALESVALPSVFDLVVGNVPFSDVGIYDPRIPKRLRRTTHDYFLVRSIEALRPGGIAILITGTGSLDRGAPTVRQHLCGEADLLLAVRLPTQVFADRGAGVASDLLVFRKLATPQPGRRLSWTETGTLPGAGAGMRGSAAAIAGTKGAITNRAFLDDPSLVIGEYDRDGRFGTPTVHDPDRSAEARAYAVRAALLRLPAGLLQAGDAAGAAGADTSQIVHARPAEAPSCVPGSAGAEHQATRVLGALRRVLAAEAAGEHGEATRWRARLLRNYGHLRAEVGPLRHAADEGRPLHGWRKHPSLPLLLALETPSGHPAPVLHGPVLQVQVAATPTDPLDALAACIDAGDVLSPEAVAARCGRAPDEVAAALRGHLYQQGPGGAWLTRAAYLAGDLPTKIREAEGWAALDETYAEHVTALRGALPAAVAPESIVVPFGAAWVPAAMYRAFFRVLFPAWGAVPDREGAVTLDYSMPTAQWLVKIRAAEIHASVDNTDTYGTPYFTAVELIEHGMALSSPIAYDETEGGGKVRNHRATIAACGKLDAIRRRWSDWILSEPVRRETLAAIFRERFAGHAPRRYDGTGLTWPGLAAAYEGKPLALHRHQRDAVARILDRGDTDDSALITHRVGAGKTIVAIVGVMKRLQLGLSRRPIVVVPRHLRDQWAAAWCALYPGHVDWLIVDGDDTTDGIARLMTGQGRILLTTYERFLAIPTEPEILGAYLQRELDELKEAQDDLDEGASHDMAKHLKRNLRARTKTIEKARVAQRDKWDAITRRQGHVIGWGAVGCDLLVADEFHFWKSLGVGSSKMEGVSGISTAESQRALDGCIKMHWLLAPQLFPGVSGGTRGKVIGMTGTPITNSLVELWVMMKLLQPNLLLQKGLWHFDAWASVFTEQYQWPELDSVGRFRTRTRLRFRNVQQILGLLSCTWDRVPASALPPRPGIVGGRMRVVPTEGSPDLREYTIALAARAEAIVNREVEPSEDNMLLVTHHGRLASLYNGPPDGLFPGLPGAIDRRTKIDALVEEVWHLYHTYDAHSGVQLIFCDLFTPKRSSSDTSIAVAPPAERWEALGLYGVIADRLVAAGVLRREIAFIHDAASDEDRSALFAAANAGTIRVLIGSTQKMGTGVNVQARALAAHHVTVPWRPDWLKQADGRVQRPGNMFTAVYILSYPTIGSYDTVLWQIVELKARMIEQIGDGSYEGESADDVGETAISASVAKAISLGDDRVLRKVELELQLETLTREWRQRQQEDRRREWEIASLPGDIANAEAALGRVEALQAHVAAHPGGGTFRARLALPVSSITAAGVVERATDALRPDDGRAAWLGRIQADRAPAAAPPEAQTVQQHLYGKPDDWQEISEEGTAGGRLVGIGQGLLHRLRNMRAHEEFIVGEWRAFQVVLASAGLQPRVLFRAPTGQVLTTDLQQSAFFFVAARLRDLDAQHAQLLAQLQTLRLRQTSLAEPIAPWSRGDEAHALLTDYRQLCEDLSTDGSADEIAFQFDRERPVPTPKPRTEDDPATTDTTAGAATGDTDADPSEPADDDGDDTDGDEYGDGELCF